MSNIDLEDAKQVMGAAVVNIIIGLILGFLIALGAVSATYGNIEVCKMEAHGYE